MGCSYYARPLYAKVVCVRCKYQAALILTATSFFCACGLRQWYEHNHNKEMDLPAIARHVQTMLYGKRFFPYYTYVIRKQASKSCGSHSIETPFESDQVCALSNLMSCLATRDLRAVGGIDRDGTGAVYSFDPVGSYERESCRAAGSAQELVQPFLDALVCRS